MSGIRKYVITGGPGVGKTSVIDELARRGYCTVPEAARQIIQEQLLLPDGILPWKNLEKFQDLVLDKQMDLQGDACERADKTGHDLIFLDRGARDGIGYLEADNKSSYLMRVDIRCDAMQYDSAFLLNPLLEYRNDSERKEDAKTARRIHDAICKAYLDTDLPVFNVPVMSIEERVGFILNKVGGD